MLSSSLFSIILEVFASAAMYEKETESITRWKARKFRPLFMSRYFNYASKK